MARREKHENVWVPLICENPGSTLDREIYMLQKFPGIRYLVIWDEEVLCSYTYTYGKLIRFDMQDSKIVIAILLQSITVNNVAI